jgi:hypothetical protein
MTGFVESIDSSNYLQQIMLMNVVFLSSGIFMLWQRTTPPFGHPFLCKEGSLKIALQKLPSLQRRGGAVSAPGWFSRQYVEL